MNRTQTVLIGVSALAAGAVIAGGVNLATAATGDDDPGMPGHGNGYGWGHFGDKDRKDGKGWGDKGAPGERGRGHDHTPVTGSERSKVADAVTKKYSDVTVETVMKDEDGSYDVFGTQGGAPVRVEVSKDLTTVELGGPGMGHGPGMPGPGGMMRDHTPVTGSERTKVVDAVTGKYKDVKVVAVLEEEDGSYDVLGTQGDAPVKVEVSKDLKTLGLDRGGPGMGMMHGRGWGGPHLFAPPATPSSTT